jgi:hypothetical protein
VPAAGDRGSRRAAAAYPRGGRAVADGNETTAVLRKDDIFVVPGRTEHKAGGSILLSEPSGTWNTGDHHEGEMPGLRGQRYRPRTLVRPGNPDCVFGRHNM